MLSATAPQATSPRSQQLPLDHYDTDKMRNGYMAPYDAVLAPLVHQEISLLELGIHRGGSLLLWRDYFPHGKIVGVDRKLPPGFIPPERVQVFEGDQTDTGFLAGKARQVAPDGFDVIIDDASHMGRCTEISFWHLFERHLKPGGLYVVKDWGTAYWPNYPDSHNYQRRRRLWRLGWIIAGVPGVSRRVRFHVHRYGMAGFIHELIDAEGAGATKIGQTSEIANIWLYGQGLAFVRKAVK